MALTVIEWVYGSAQLGAMFLSIIAGLIALSMFKASRKTKILGAWKFMIISLVLFALEEVVGALKTFGVYKTAYLTHVIPSFILVFLIAALIKQIQINKGWVD